MKYSYVQISCVVNFHWCYSPLLIGRTPNNPNCNFVCITGKVMAKTACKHKAIFILIQLYLLLLHIIYTFHNGTQLADTLAVPNLVRYIRTDCDVSRKMVPGLDISPSNLLLFVAFNKTLKFGTLDPKLSFDHAFCKNLACTLKLRYIMAPFFNFTEQSVRVRLELKVRI